MVQKVDMVNQASERPDEVGDTLHRLLHGYRRALHEAVEAEGVDLAVGQIRVLKGVVRHPEPSAQSIADRMRRDKAQIARLVKSLEDLGLVERRSDPDDARRLLLRPTRKGRAVHTKLQRAETRASERLSAGLAAADVRAFRRIADGMIQNLKERDDG